MIRGRKMRAVAVRRFGELALMTDLPAPGAEDSVLIGVSYAGRQSGGLAACRPADPELAFPFRSGRRCGRVGRARSSPGNSGFTSATGFSGWHAPTGSYAEYTAVPTGGRTEPLARIPDSVPDDQAAALPVAAIAALGSLELLALAPGQRLVVMGAASRRLRGSDGCGSRSACHRDRARRRRRQRSAPTGCRGRLRRRRRRRCSRTARVPPDGVDAIPRTSSMAPPGSSETRGAHPVRPCFHRAQSLTRQPTRSPAL